MCIGKIHSLLIILRSVFITVRYSMVIFYKAFRGQLDRAAVDRISRQWSNRLAHYVKINHTVSNPHNVKFEPQQRYIIMSNHASLYDIPLIFLSFPGSIRMLAKKDLARVPILGHVMKASGFPFIDRKNRTQAIKDLSNAKKMMEDGMIIWIAPEGTRSHSDELQPLKKGGFYLAIESGATIIPAAIIGSRKVLPAKTTNFHIGQTVAINIGKPIDASKYSVEQIDQLINDFRADLQTLLNEGSKKS